MGLSLWWPYGFSLLNLVYTFSSLFTVSIVEMIGISLRVLLRCFHSLMFLLRWEINNSCMVEPRMSSSCYKPTREKDLFCWVSDGKCLVLLDPSWFIWTSVNTGDEIPATAVIGGYATVATPLYVARKRFGPYMMFGLYDVVTKNVHIDYNRYREVDPRDVLHFIGINEGNPQYGQ